jgi:hypothetical protein
VKRLCETDAVQAMSRSSIWTLWLLPIIHVILITCLAFNFQLILALSNAPTKLIITTTKTSVLTSSTPRQDSPQALLLAPRPHEQVLSFDTVTKYPLQELVAAALECSTEELGELHCRSAEDFASAGHSIRASLAATRTPLRSVELLRRALSEKWKKSPQKREWENEYLPRIVRDVVGTEIFPTEDRLLYQRAPMLRFHVAWPLEPEEAMEYDDTVPPIGGRNPGTLAGIHTDQKYGHPSGEVNFFLPVTPETFGTNSLFVEGEALRGDYEPFHLQYGEMMMWKGNDCRHCSPRNISNQTRISFDFRVIPGSDWEEPSTAENAFQLGSYYMDALEVAR